MNLPTHLVEDVHTYVPSISWNSGSQVDLLFNETVGLHHIEIPGILLGVGQLQILFREPCISVSIILFANVLVEFVGLCERIIGQMTLDFRLRPEGEQLWRGCTS